MNTSVKVTADAAQTFAALYDRMVATATPAAYQRKAAWDRSELAQQPETQDWDFDNVRLFTFYQDVRNDGLTHEAAIVKAESQIR